MSVKTDNHYLAYVLDPLTRDNLLVWYGEHMRRHSVIACHHITIAYDFTPEQLPILKEFINTNPVFITDKYLLGDGIDCFTVRANSKADRPFGGKFHLTAARSISRSNKESNDLISGIIPTFNTIDALMYLKGSFQLIPKGK